ncbi:MAG: 5'-methylthioadenosine phosphorylase [Herpetosiphonaceae bacterium]|nr:MAG: 5'-methylthioadenosine phosphorylase [Herpetosiphonaceae bacterium]
MMDQTQHTTPYGTASLILIEHTSGQVALLCDEDQPHAAIYAAKALGATRVIEVVSARPLDRLLDRGDIVLPDDLVDLTCGRRSTFFVGKGYGFIPQRPVFCPEVRSALLAGVRAGGGRSFARGTLAVVEDWGQSQAAREWGAHILASTVAPAAYLAKELELCYAPLCIVEEEEELPAALLSAAIEHLPPARLCSCQSAMQPARQRGLVGDDWRLWMDV